MDVKTLCLGVLSLGECSGYEIRKQFEDGPFSNFCDAGFGSIYPALRKLSAEGLIAAGTQQEDARPDKKVYRITTAGRHALYEALLERPGRDKLRSDLMFTLFFGHILPARHLDLIIQDRIDFYRDALTRMEGCANQDSLPGEQFVRGLGQAIYTAAAQYLEEHRHELVGAALLRQAVAE